MTQISTDGTAWASSVDAQVVDPDTDVDHPSGTGGPGKVAKGWLSQTEPQEWENWLINRYQSKMLNRLVRGVHQIDDGVTYKSNSIVWDVNGKVYLAKNSSTGAPTTDATRWEEAISFSQSAWLAITNQMVTDYNAHIVPNVVKHGETIEGVGGYSASTITGILADTNTSATDHINAHYPHHETAIQVGTIPTTGGAMTGLINYAQGFAMSDFDEVTVNAQAEIAGLGAPNGAAFGIGYDNYHNGGRIVRLVDDSDSSWLDAEYGQLFLVPLEDISVPLVSGLQTVGCDFTVDFTRNNTLTYTDKGGSAQVAAINTPAFEALGLKLDANTVISITPATWPWSYIDMATVSYRLNGVKTVKFLQFTPRNLQAIFGTTGNIRDFRVWFKRLTDQQVASIP